MCKFIIKGRGQGKTAELIKLSAQTGATIICRNKERCCLVRDMAKDLGFEIPEPMHIKQMSDIEARIELYENCKKSIGKILVDDVDEVLEEFLGFPCDAITGSSSSK